MNKRIAFPFLTLEDSAVGFRGWMIGDPGQPLKKASDILEGWDYERDLEVNTGFRFDFGKVAQALDIPETEIVLSVILKSGTGSGSMPKRVDRLAVVYATVDKPNPEVSAIISSWKLSGRLRLELVVLVARKPRNGGVLSPTQVGAKLWADSLDILLEDGGDSRFPIEVISFKQVFQNKDHESAPWYVYWQAGNLDGDFGGAVRVYVNSDDKVLSERFVNGDTSTLQAILGDVMIQMISSVILMDNCEEALSHCQEGSVGQQVDRWIDIAFPNSAFSSIRASLEATPGRFHATVLAAARFGG